MNKTTQQQIENIRGTLSLDTLPESTRAELEALIGNLEMQLQRERTKAADEPIRFVLTDRTFEIAGFDPKRVGGIVEVSNGFGVRRGEIVELTEDVTGRKIWRVKVDGAGVISAHDPDEPWK